MQRAAKLQAHDRSWKVLVTVTHSSTRASTSCHNNRRRRTRGAALAVTRRSSSSTATAATAVGVLGLRLRRLLLAHDGVVDEEVGLGDDGHMAPPQQADNDPQLRPPAHHVQRPRDLVHLVRKFLNIKGHGGDSEVRVTDSRPHTVDNSHNA